MDISKDFDTIYNDLLIAHYNKSGKSAGLLMRIMYWAVSVCAWGIYKAGTWIGKQIVPDTASRAWLERHAKMRGLTLDSTESNAELLERYIEDIQYPPAGGCLKDWVRWAKEVTYTHDSGLPTEWTESVTYAMASDNDRYAGSINVVVVSDRTESGYEGIATTELLAAITTHLNVMRPLGIWDFIVYPAAHLSTSVTMQVTTVDFATVKASIEEVLPAFMNSLLPGKSLSLAQIFSIAIECGATDATITVPSSTVNPANGPTSYERVIPNVITVTEI